MKYLDLHVLQLQQFGEAERSRRGIRRYVGAVLMLVPDLREN